MVNIPYICNHLQTDLKSVELSQIDPWKKSKWFRSDYVSSWDHYIMLRKSIVQKKPPIMSNFIVCHFTSEMGRWMLKVLLIPIATQGHLWSLVIVKLCWWAMERHIYVWGVGVGGGVSVGGSLVVGMCGWVGGWVGEGWIIPNTHTFGLTGSPALFWAYTKLGLLTVW